jgi:hypothetical protein
MAVANKSIKIREDDLEAINTLGGPLGLDNIQMVRAMVVLWNDLRQSGRKTDEGRLDRAVLNALASDRELARAS